MIDEIRLVSVDGKLKIELLDELAALIDVGANKQPRTCGSGVQSALVAGPVFRVWTPRWMQVSFLGSRMWSGAFVCPAS